MQRDVSARNQSTFEMGAIEMLSRRCYDSQNLCFDSSKGQNPDSLLAINGPAMASVSCAIVEL
jgi:hypothetical protein